jgi:alpha-1,6-mannosyltransferase
MRRAGAPKIEHSQAVTAPGAGHAARHLVDVTVFYAPTSGGVRRYLLAKHAWLAQRAGWKHTVLVPGPLDEGLPGGIVHFGSPAIPLGVGYRVPLRMRAFRSRLADLAPDLIEVGDPYHLAGPSLEVARRLKIPAITFCHSDLGALAESLLGRWAGRAAGRHLAGLYARFDLVLAPSQVVAERLCRIGVRRVEVQSLGVDVATFHPGARDPDLRPLLGIPLEKRLLVFAGRLSPEKHVTDLLAAMKHLGPRYHLLVIGDGRVAPAAPGVTALHYQQDPRQLARLLASCDLFVHAGDQETFGLVVLEAMACGLPVVAARAGALPELVDDRVGATFRPRDTGDLAAKVRDQFERDTAEIGRAARARAEAHGWEAVFGRLLLRYRKVLGRPALLDRPVRNAA